MSSRTTAIWRPWPCQSKMFLRRRPGTHWTAVQGSSCDLTVAACAGVLADRSGWAAVIGGRPDAPSAEAAMQMQQLQRGRAADAQVATVTALVRGRHGDTARRSHAAARRPLALAARRAPVAVPSAGGGDECGIHGTRQTRAMERVSGSARCQMEQLQRDAQPTESWCARRRGARWRWCSLL